MCYSVIVGTCTILTGEFIGKIYLSKDLEFSEGGGGVSPIRQGVWGQLKSLRSPWVFGAKSSNLAISRHFIQTFGKPCFPLLILKDFHQILHQLGLW